MPHLHTLVCLCAVSSSAAWAQAQPGQWEVRVTLQGAPSGGGTTVQTACLAADRMAAAPEQALLDVAGTSPNKDRPSLRCTVKDVQRGQGKSAWQSSCEGPRGAMPGQGSATIDAQSAELVQSFEVKTPMGTRSLQQTVRAKRVADC